MPSGSLRVRVYSGVDVLTGRDLYLKETIPAGRQARARAEKTCAEFIRQVEEGRQPRTNATLSQLVDVHLTSADTERRNNETLQGYARKHIHATSIGRRTIGEIGPQALETLYMRSSDAAETTATADRPSGTTRRPTIDAPAAAGDMCAVRWRRGPSARSIS